MGFRSRFNIEARRKWVAVSAAGVAGFVAASLFAVTHFAGSNQPRELAFGWQSSPVRQGVVEQQTDENVCQPSTPGYPGCAVINPTAGQGYDDGWGCAWDIDDNSLTYGTGALTPGSSAAWEQCKVAEGFKGPPDVAHCEFGCGSAYGVRIQSVSDGLEVLSCFAPPGRCFTSRPVYQQATRRYSYDLCLRILYPYGEWETPVPGSNGGVGTITQETTTVRNPTGKTVRGITAYITQVGIGQAPIQTPGCVYYAADAQRDDPFRWSP